MVAATEWGRQPWNVTLGGDASQLAKALHACDRVNLSLIEQAVGCGQVGDQTNLRSLPIMRMTIIKPSFEEAPAGEVRANPNVAADQDEAGVHMQLAKVFSQRRYVMGHDAGDIRLDVNNADDVRLHPPRVSAMELGKRNEIAWRNEAKDVVNANSEILVDVRNDWHLDFHVGTNGVMIAEARLTPNQLGHVAIRISRDEFLGSAGGFGAQLCGP